MSWISPARVALLVRTELDNDEYMTELIDHVQGLCEVVIGVQEEPVSRGLASTFAEIVARMWRASRAAEANPQGYQSEAIEGAYSYQFPSGGPPLSGFGLTDRERQALRAAVGRAGMWVQPLTRGGLETAPHYYPYAAEPWYGDI